MQTKVPPKKQKHLCFTFSIPFAKDIPLSYSLYAHTPVNLLILKLDATQKSEYEEPKNLLDIVSSRSTHGYVPINAAPRRNYFL